MYTKLQEVVELIAVYFGNEPGSITDLDFLLEDPLFDPAKVEAALSTLTSEELKILVSDPDENEAALDAVHAKLGDAYQEVQAALDSAGELLVSNEG